MPEAYPLTSAVVPALDYTPQVHVSKPELVVSHSGARPRPAVQRGLFSDPKRVVSLPVAPAPAGKSRRTQQTRSVSRRSTLPGQREFDFHTEEPVPVPHVYCSAPVANPGHRVLAAALDLSMVLLSLGLFLGTFLVAGGELVLNWRTAGLYGSILAVLFVFYHALFCVCGADTPGMRWTQLRLLNFDGHTPDRDQRMYRMCGSLVSLFAAGLGLVWALVDEEQLTWHDHMSKTFPTPYQLSN
jgi:uncharacterized RDD family membrane protein YckC